MPFLFKLVRTIEHSYNSQINNNEDLETETAMLGLVNEYTEDEEIALTPLDKSSMSAMGSPSSSKISSKLKCPGCMRDADPNVDFEFTEMSSG